MVALDARLAPIPPFAGVRLLEPQGLRCAYRDGARPYLLHHASRKPWLVRMRSNVYSRLLTRLLLAPDVALRLDPGELPLVLRTGSAAGAARLVTDLLMTVPGAVRRLRRRPAPARVAQLPRHLDRAAPGHRRGDRLDRPRVSRRSRWRASCAPAGTVSSSIPSSAGAT